MYLVDKTEGKRIQADLNRSALTALVDHLTILRSARTNKEINERGRYEEDYLGTIHRVAFSF
jgi:hypothetical protein